MKRSTITLSEKADRALLTPSAYLRSRHFVLNDQRKATFILVAGIVSVLLIAPLAWSVPRTLPALIADAINIALYAVGVRGCYVALYALAVAEIELAVAESITTRAPEHLKKPLELRKLTDSLVVHNPTDPPLAMTRIVRHVQQEAHHLRFGSDAEVIQPYMDETIESLFEIVNLQKIALRGGICATFIGLLLALRQLGGVGAAVGGDVMGLITSQLGSSLYIAFSGSAVGLQVALVLGGLLVILRAKQNRLSRAMLEATACTLELARRARNEGEEVWVAELTAVQQRISKLSDRIHDHIGRLEACMGVTAERINLQTETIRSGLVQLTETKSSYDRVVNDVAAAHNNFVREIQGVYQQLSLGQFRDGIRAGIVEAGERIAGSINITEQAIQKQNGEMSDGVRLIRQVTDDLAKFLKKLDDSHAEALIRVRDEMSKSASIQSNLELRASIEQLGSSVDRLSLATARLNEAVNTPILGKLFGGRR